MSDEFGKDILREIQNDLSGNLDDNAVKERLSKMKDFQIFMMMYGCAIKEIKTKFEVLNDDLSVSYKRNPIQVIKSRIKRPESIFRKLARNNYDITMTSILENLSDVAGIRVICSFVDDIYEVAKMLSSQDDITVLEVKDYIKNPKPNGYRSYHMVVEVPVFFASQKRQMKVEVQFRTIAMDFWASLEHSMQYKKNRSNGAEIIQELYECAETIAKTDLKMQEINKKIMQDND